MTALIEERATFFVGLNRQIRHPIVTCGITPTLIVDLTRSNKIHINEENAISEFIAERHLWPVESSRKFC